MILHQLLLVETIIIQKLFVYVTFWKECDKNAKYLST